MHNRIHQGPGALINHFKTKNDFDPISINSLIKETLTPEDFEKTKNGFHPSIVYYYKVSLFHVILSTIINQGATEACLYLEEAINIALQVFSFYLSYKSIFLKIKCYNFQCIFYYQDDITSLEDRLKNIDFAVAYSSLLSNNAEIKLFLGKVDEAYDNVSSSIKALNILETVQRSSEEEYEYKVKVLPVLSRALCMLAVRTMQIGDAITAEGLFRQSIDYLNSPLRWLDLDHRLFCNQYIII